MCQFIAGHFGFIPVFYKNVKSDILVNNDS